MSSSELDTRNIAVSMRKSVENLVISSQDAIGQSISQALSFSGVITQSNTQVLQENRSVSRSPSPSLRHNSDTSNVDNNESDKDFPAGNLIERPFLQDAVQGGGDSGDVTPRYQSGKVSSTTPPKSADGTGRSKKKSWYSALYPSYKTRSEDFKRLFKDLPDDERLIVDYSCALQKDILNHGRLYASQNYLCFHANIFGWETFVALRWKDITAITKEKTALVIPNAILVCTETEKNFLTSFSGRDKAYLMLFRVWQNALMDQPMSSHEIWQWVHSCYGEELGFNSDDEGYARDDDDKTPLPPSLLIEELGESSSMETGGGGLDSRDRDDPRRDSSPPLVTNGDASNERRTFREEDAADTLPTDMSDSSGSDDKHHNAGATEPCPCAHSGKLVLSQQFNLNIDTLFTLVFTSSKLYLELLAARNTRDYVQEPWQQNPETGLKSRQIKYTLGLTAGPIGPKEVDVTETQTMHSCSKPGVQYAIDCVSENAGIPYADYFTVDAHYCLRREGDHVTSLRVYGQLQYKRSVWPMVKSFLEKNAISGLEQYLVLLERRLQAEAERAPAKRKGRRRRRATLSVQEAPLSAAPPLLVAGARAPAAPSRVLPLLLAGLLLLNLLLCWQLYHAASVDLSDRVVSVSAAQSAQFVAQLERHTQRHRAQLLAWRAALAAAQTKLIQTEQALTTLLESIQPSLERAQREARTTGEL